MSGIAIMTSGGDAAGMNPAIKAAVDHARQLGMNPYVVYDGLEGLIDGKIKEATRELTSDMIYRGGTLLRSSRSKRFFDYEFRRQAYEHLKERNIDKLIIMGGDGSFRALNDFFNDFEVPFAGIPATYLYNTLAGIIRALGDSRTPVYFLILSSLLNIVLDLFFIVQIGTGTAGAAYATVIAQAVSGILCLIYMKKKFDILKMHREETRISTYHLYRLCMMGIPMGLQYSITAIGSVVIQTAINSLGSIAVASVTAGQKIGMFFCCPFDALGGTMATYAGQNAGAGKTDRIRQGVRSATFIGSIYSVLACIVLTLFGGVIPLLFVDASETVVIHQAHQFLTFNSLFYIPLTIVNVWRFTIQGMGYSLLAILAGVCEMIARALVGFALVPIFGYIIICFASPLAWLMADAFLIPAFYYCLRNLLKAQEMLE